MHFESLSCINSKLFSSNILQQSSFFIMSSFFTRSPVTLSEKQSYIRMEPLPLLIVGVIHSARIVPFLKCLLKWPLITLDLLTHESTVGTFPHCCVVQSLWLFVCCQFPRSSSSFCVAIRLWKFNIFWEMCFCVNGYLSLSSPIHLGRNFVYC